MSQAKLLFVHLLFLLLTHLRQATADTGATTSAPWVWRTGPPSVIRDQVNAGYRITNLQLISTAPYTLTALFVRDQGGPNTWYWFYNIDGVTLSEKLETLNARIVDLEPYTISANRCFAVVLRKNTLDDANTWWYYYDVSPRFIDDKLELHNARLVDLDVYKVAGFTRYSAVMTRDSANNPPAWWWYCNVSEAFIRQKLAENRARLTHIERNVAGKYSVIMEKTSVTWWYYYAQSSSELLQKASQNGARVVYVEPYSDNGIRKYNGIMLSNVNDLTRRVYDVLVPERSGGAFGFYMKQIGGPVRAALQQNYEYEPASSIKALHLAHTMQRVQSGSEDLNSIVFYFNDLRGSCPRNSGVVRERLETVLQKMMRASSNTATQGICARYGDSAINLSAQKLGMTKSKIRHRIGCAGSSPGIAGQIDEPNSLTLVDITRLYEQVAISFLSGTYRAKFFDIMSSFTTLSTIVTEEASKLSLLTREGRDQFKSLMYSRQKGGSYKVSGKHYRSIGGYVQLPFRSCGGDISFKEYVFGAFIHQSTTSVKSGLTSKAGAETMRDEIRKALFSFQPCLSIVKGFEESS